MRHIRKAGALLTGLLLGATGFVLGATIKVDTPPALEVTFETTTTAAPEQSGGPGGPGGQAEPEGEGATPPPTEQVRTVLLHWRGVGGVVNNQFGFSPNGLNRRQDRANIPVTDSVPQVIAPVGTFGGPLRLGLYCACPTGDVAGLTLTVVMTDPNSVFSFGDKQRDGWDNLSGGRWRKYVTTSQRITTGKAEWATEGTGAYAELLNLTPNSPAGNTLTFTVTTTN